MDSEITSRGWQDSGSCNAIFGGSNIVIKYAYIYVIRVFHGLFVIKKLLQNERTKQVRSLVGAREDGLMACARNSCGILYSVLLVLSNFRLQNFILAYHGADLACVMDIHSWSTGPEWVKCFMDARYTMQRSEVVSGQKPSRHGLLVCFRREIYFCARKIFIDIFTERCNNLR